MRANVQATVLDDAFRKCNGNPRSEQRVDHTAKVPDEISTKDLHEYEIIIPD